jgi:hypothetical protein
MLTKMIIFDTSELFGLNRGNSKFDFLRALRYSNVERAGIPWMVREELVAQQVIEYRNAYIQAESAINQLNRRTFWSRTPVALPSPRIERAKRYWRDQFAEVLETLQTSGASARAALAREAFREKPAKITTKEKSGARDVAIWLSVVDYLRANPNDPVYFVTSNVKDFGDGTAYESPMLEDLGDMAARLTYLTSFDDCISRFSTTIDANLEDVKELLSNLVGASLTPIVRAAHTTLSGGRFEGTRLDESFEPFHWTAWILPPSAAVREVTEASGHRLGDAEWYTASVDWILEGLTQPAGPLYGSVDISAVMPTACQWRTKVLFSAGQEPKLAIVDFEAPRAFDPSDRSTLEPLLDSIMARSSSSSLLGTYIASLLEPKDLWSASTDTAADLNDADQSFDLSRRLSPFIPAP